MGAGNGPFLTNVEINIFIELALFLTTFELIWAVLVNMFFYYAHSSLVSQTLWREWDFVQEILKIRDS